MQPFFSLVMWVNNVNEVYYRDALESLLQQTYDDFELYIMDNDGTGIVGKFAREFFPGNDRIHVRQLKNHRGGAYAMNVGVHFCEGNYIILMGCHDRLAPNTLSELRAEILRHDEPGVIYTDHDELIGIDIMNPHFKEHFNKALLLRSFYMGDFLCIASEICSRVGNFNEKLSAAYIYEFLLRCMHAGANFYHVPRLLYHKRMPSGYLGKEIRRANTRNYKEHVMVAKAFLDRTGVEAKVEAEPGERRWKVSYDGSDYEIHNREFIFMKNEQVRLLNRRVLETMYGFIKQKDIAVVGIRFLGQAFTVDNVGFFVDETGEAYPAFHGDKIYRESYENLATIPRDCSLVDPGCCMIDAKVYRKLGGFNPKLTGRDAMLDFSMRAREKGLRTIVVPYISGRYKEKEVISNEESRATLNELWKNSLAEGDAFYNKNLNIGMINYRLPGDIEEKVLPNNVVLNQQAQDNTTLTPSVPLEDISGVGEQQNTTDIKM